MCKNHWVKCLIKTVRFCSSVKHTVGTLNSAVCWLETFPLTLLLSTRVYIFKSYSQGGGMIFKDLGKKGKIKHQNSSFFSFFKRFTPKKYFQNLGNKTKELGEQLFSKEEGGIFKRKYTPLNIYPCYSLGNRGYKFIPLFLTLSSSVGIRPTSLIVNYQY